MAPRKVRSVASLVKGLPLSEAEAQLMLLRRRAAKPLLKLLRSAAANLKNNKRMNPDNFYVESFAVDGGPMLKRHLPRARGMATPIQKKTSHVTLLLAENLNAKEPRFKISVPKKTKLPSAKKGARQGKQPKEKAVAPEVKRPGFFKKLFSRKSRFAK